MSTFKEALRSGLEEYLERLQVAIEGLTPAEVRWQPTMNTNPIAWMVWHMARSCSGSGLSAPRKAAIPAIPHIYFTNSRR